MAPKGSLNAKPKPVLRGVVVAAAGELGEKMTDASLLKWLRNFGGRFSTDFDDSVTHLLATDEQFKKKVERVKKAMDKKIDIVHPDWLEMSLSSNKKLALDKYSHMKIRKAENEKKRRSEQKQKGIKQGESYINSNKYRIYMDSTGFPYQITLTREEGERFIVELWESKSKPKLYYTGVKYHKKARARAFTHRPSETPGSLNRELKIFCMTFLRKTGVDWNDRLEKAKTSNGIVTGVGGGKHGGYRYEMPTRGKPIGLVNGEDLGIFTLSNGDDDKSAATVDAGTVQSSDNAEKNNDYDTHVENLLLKDVRDFTYDLGSTVPEIQQDTIREDITNSKQSISTPPATPIKQTKIIVKSQNKPSISKQVPVAATKANSTRVAPKRATSSDRPCTAIKRPKGAFNMRRSLQSSATRAPKKALAARTKPVDVKKLLKAKGKAAATNRHDTANNSGIDKSAKSHHDVDLDFDVEMEDVTDGAAVALEDTSPHESDVETTSCSDGSILEEPHVDKVAGIEQMMEQDSGDDAEEQTTESEEEHDSGSDE